MDFLKKLFSGSPIALQSNFYSFAVRCDRCGEIIEGHINLGNDLSLSEEMNHYFVHKTLMGDGKCFQRIEVEIKFDASKRLTERQAQGGTFVAKR